MEYVIGGLLGISISSLYWGIKFSELSKENENLYIEYTERLREWKRLELELMNKTKIKNKKPRGGISCK